MFVYAADMPMKCWLQSCGMAWASRGTLSFSLAGSVVAWVPTDTPAGDSAWCSICRGLQPLRPSCTSGSSTSVLTSCKLCVCFMGYTSLTLGSPSAGLSWRRGPSLSGAFQASCTWPALVWREKTKRKMNKTLLFCHVKWLEVILMFGFLPITEAFMNFQLCQENITFVHCWLPSWCELHNFLLRRRLL